MVLQRATEARNEDHFVLQQANNKYEHYLSPSKHDSKSKYTSCSYKRSNANVRIVLESGRKCYVAIVYDTLEHFVPTKC